MQRANAFSVLDPLYGDISFSEAISDLMSRPLMQRLRHVRLSNIDSIDMPGISGITRFEHAIGTAHLVDNVGFRSDLSIDDHVLLQAAALVHDSAITPFGHLVEEALQYVTADFDHESKWSLLLSDSASQEDLGGTEVQLFLGRSSGLREWATKVYRGEGPDKLDVLTQLIRGRGRFGSCIAGSLDLDNLDNVVRVAFHMGLMPDVTLPSRLCKKMRLVRSDGVILFDTSAEVDIELWGNLRKRVYERLMPARTDFAGKAMLLACTIDGLAAGVLNQATSWTMTDGQYLSALMNAPTEDIRVTVERWLLGDVWELSDLMWMNGNAPSLDCLGKFAAELTDIFKRRCFAYRIKDKRDRVVSTHLVDGREITSGRKSELWLLGVASPLKRPFSSDQNRLIAELAETSFNTSATFVTEQAGGLF